ncbi:MAG: type II secretion system protein [Bryobacterales bacterium]|nr:type II secretion system protein [Bryobacterales bacterium]
MKQMKTVSSRRAGEQGFTLIELIVVVSTTAVMMALLLPAVQRVRTLANESKAGANLRQMAVALQTHHRTAQAFPATLADAMKVAGFPENGEVDGFKASSYAVGPSGWTVAMNPKPGVTGSQTAIARGMVGGGFAIEWKPTPGAEEGRAAMLAKMQTAAGLAVAEILALPRTETERQQLRQDFPFQVSLRSSVQDGFRNLAGADGRVSLESSLRGGHIVATGSKEVRSIWKGLAEEIARAMDLGAYGEKWQQLPGVLPADIDGTAEAKQKALGFGLTRIYTTSYVPNAVAQRQLLMLLAEAESRQSRGDRTGALEAFKQYEAEVQRLESLPVPLVSPQGAQVLGVWSRSGSWIQ